jgi:DNA-binding transcriptional regulator YdaS (Cro superfamily)
MLADGGRRLTSRLLTLKKPETAAAELERHFPAEIRALEETVRRASTGDWPAACEYVRHWRQLTDGLVILLQHQRPDLVVKAADGRLLIVDAKGDPTETTPERLLAVAAIAPCSGWVARTGLGRGIALKLLAEIREQVPGAIPLVPKAGLCTHWASGDAVRTAVRLIERAVGRQSEDDERPVGSARLLKRSMELFGLDKTELARLFGVRRQAVEQWERRGVPAERQAKLATVVAVGELLARRLRPGLLPGVARRQAAAYHGRTMLEMIRQDRHDELLEDVRESFDWASTA